MGKGGFQFQFQFKQYFIDYPQIQMGKKEQHKQLFTIDTIDNVNNKMFMNFQVGLNDSGEYRCGSDLTGEAFVRVNVVAGETEQELKSFHLDSDSIASRAAKLEMLQIFIILTFCLFLQIR